VLDERHNVATIAMAFDKLSQRSQLNRRKMTATSVHQLFDDLHGQLAVACLVIHIRIFGCAESLGIDSLNHFPKLGNKETNLLVGQGFRGSPGKVQLHFFANRLRLNLEANLRLK